MHLSRAVRRARAVHDRPYLYDTSLPARYPEPRFPCDAFLVRRHRHEGYVVDIQCTGQPLKPELLAPPFGEDVWRQGALPKDGAIIVDATYDQIKRLRIGPLRIT